MCVSLLLVAPQGIITDIQAEVMGVGGIALAHVALPLSYLVQVRADGEYVAIASAGAVSRNRSGGALAALPAAIAPPVAVAGCFSTSIYLLSILRRRQLGCFGVCFFSSCPLGFHPLSPLGPMNWGAPIMPHSAPVVLAHVEPDGLKWRPAGSRLLTAAASGGQRRRQAVGHQHIRPRAGHAAVQAVRRGAGASAVAVGGAPVSGLASSLSLEHASRLDREEDRSCMNWLQEVYRAWLACGVAVMT